MEDGPGLVFSSDEEKGYEYEYEEENEKDPDRGLFLSGLFGEWTVLDGILWTWPNDGFSLTHLCESP
jgi:hypothetical protein